MPREFTRPESSFPFTFGGVKTNERPDSLPPTKYPVAVNVRSYSQNQVRTRPGLVRLFSAGPAASAPDLRAYTTLGTDDLPRILLRASDDTIWLDNGVQVGTLAGAGGTLGASMIPFRPNQSPQPWMYVANGNDYQKFSAPAFANTVTQQKVGIAEPQLPPNAVQMGNYSIQSLFAPQSLSWYTTDMAPVWLNDTANPLTIGGTAGATSAANRLVFDQVISFFPDPAYAAAGSPGSPTAPAPIPISIQTGSTNGYSKFMMLQVGSTITRVLDVFTPISSGIVISAIYYFSGSTGRCIIVPSLPLGTDTAADQSIYGTTQLSNLRRGALIKVGTEVCFVLSVTEGPNGSIAIETSTTVNHNTLQTLSGVPSISVSLPPASWTSAVISSPIDTFSVTIGLGTITSTPISTFVNSGYSYQSEDYIHVSIRIDNLTSVNELRLLFDVGDGSFTQNFYYYTIRPADIAAAIANTITQLAAAQNVIQRAAIDEEAAISAGNQGVTFSGAQSATGSGQWTEIMFPISELTRVGNDETKSLQTLVKFQLLVNANATVSAAFGGLYITGGYQVDVGDVGAPIRYRYRGRSSVTGAVSNPSPETRYGVNPRRNEVLVNIPNGTTPYDSQIDTWDIYRYGGAITSWRYVGSIPISTANFVDNFNDSAVSAGAELDFDNFEPWPSIDLPNNGTINSLTGTVATVSSPPSKILSYLPGTLVIIGGQNVYTLQTRPTLISGNVYLLQFVESAGAISPFIGLNYLIQEPLIANQHLPYMWGPDVNGTVFACGDSLRPGTLYFSKGNIPDAAPDTYNIEIVNPSEPLLGGEVVDGLSFVGSSKRWWALYPQPDNPSQRYNFVEQPFTRGLAAPFGHSTDGKRVFYWAKDGIWANDESLTDADLYTIFPHEGVPGQVVTYNGISILPPDYAQAPKFRLAYANGYLYATYPYINGSGSYAPVLVCDLRTKAWSLDNYTNSLVQGQVKNVYQIEQTPESQGARNSVVLLVRQQVGALTANVCIQTDLTNDDGQAISCQVATFEFDGGDKRAPKQWGDVFVDCRPAATSGLSATPMSLGTPVAAASIVPTSANRTRVPLSVGGIIVSDFLGAFFQWTDDFTQQSQATHLYLWQPSFSIQPAYELSWTSFGTAFNGKGYQHLRQLTLAWVSNAPITISIQTFDGLDPVPIVVPSSGGAYQKAVFPFSANKGLLFSFTASSPLPFQIFNDDSELYVGEWGRQGEYQVFRGFGGRTVDDASI